MEFAIKWYAFGLMCMISVIIPVYNASRYLGECLESILNQSYKDVEIILINDGSTDNSLAICKEYSELYDNIKYKCQENMGVSCARNRGLEIARGDYISFVDADDWLEGDFYEHLLNIMLKYDADISMCDYSLDDDQCNSLLRNGNEYFFQGNDAVRFIVRNMRGGPCDKLYKRDVIGSIRFNESIRIAEDTLFNVEVMKNISRLVKSDYKLYHYRIWEGSTSGKWTVGKVENSFVAYDSMIRICRENSAIILDIEYAMRVCLLNYLDCAVNADDRVLYDYLRSLYKTDERMRRGVLSMGVSGFVKMLMLYMPYKCTRGIYECVKSARKLYRDIV